ncbi:MAG: LacI family transcriptional regulator [Sphaerochaeta sp.]|jgi:LacI family transcriptional regulator|nr:LacI family transcriptional regulator [Sphaerochaeta sp.]MCI2046025.1 LacI family transcriptional regulator [Sphaerochaeta sp.]MCI2076993.1 LacI family transcriptional regulator [Sphaerochaeta sp.]MCI2104577.1 LacI family transcriptional regulator [Sphaerochaeta sp.]MCI2129254.1 LacI family transcriptional regulator [Sphaerochaeta sp.]
MKHAQCTLQDIATRVGCSAAAVSMILAGKQHGRFSRETIQKVYLTAKEMGYQAKHRLPSEGIIMIICPSVINPYYATLLQGMEAEAEHNGYNTIIFTTYWSLKREQKALQMSASPQVLGIIFAMAPQQPDMVREVAKTTPVVTVSDRQSHYGLDSVEVDNYDAGYRIGSYLIQLGHQHVCYLSTSLNTQHSSRVLRYQGLVDSYANLQPQGSVSVLSQEVESSQELATVEIEYQVGRMLAKRCIATLPKVTAMVAINDMIAYGVMDETLEEGFRIPQDYSVSGFDDIYPSQFHNVALTTIDHHINQRGHRAFSLMQAKLEHRQEPASFTHVEFTNFLVVRATTAPPRTIGT